MLVQDVERRCKLVHVGQGWGRIVHAGADYRKMMQVCAGMSRMEHIGAGWYRIVYDCAD